MKTTEESVPQTPTPTHQSTTFLSLARPAKISPLHLEKLAIVYVRQSSPQQVLENRESTARQYALADHARALGWPAERVLVIDDDQGQSGSRAEHRHGFQRLLAEVTMDHVGMVLALEMSRLARSDKDWNQLVEVCALFGVLLADQDGVYDAHDPNDRLLLGLKGVMSAAELFTMRNRLDRGRINKAQRGELFFSAPVGYILLPTGGVELDPDEQARSVVKMLFDKFDDIGSVGGLWHWLVDKGIRLPVRQRSGPHKGQIDWRVPSLGLVNRVFHHPIYAGAYAYGQRPVDPKRSYTDGRARVGKWLPVDQWRVLIRDHLPAYITWERFQRNQQRLKQNLSRADTPGTPRQGCALLGGVLVCGSCGWRMCVSYRTISHPQYRCDHKHACASGPDCPGLAANGIDEAVSLQVLRALEPAALEVSLQARGDLRRERERLNLHWQQNLKRARYDAELAERRYHAVDPENRLVASNLERQWEAALRQERDLKEEYDRFCRQEVKELTEEDEMQIRALASDIPTLWNAAKTTNADRKSIIRCLIDRIVVHPKRNSERTEVIIHWAGGHESHFEIVRPVRDYSQLDNGDLLRKRLVELREAGKTAAQTAEILNAEGFSPINPRLCFKGSMVRDLLLKLDLRSEKHDDTLLQSGEWWIRDLAKEIEMPWQTLREWAKNGWAHGRQTKLQKLWILWADQEEVSRLRKLRSASSHGIQGYSPEFTTPKPRPPM